MAIQNTTTSASQAIRYAAIGALAVAAFFGAYRYAQASSSEAQPAAATTSAAAAAPADNGAVTSAGAQPASNGGGSAASAGGGCCGGASGASGGCCGGGGGNAAATASVPGKTTLSGGVQKVTIDLTTGSYSPNHIIAKADVPLELDFKGPASGCNGTVVSQQLGFQQDVSNGGTIKLQALQPGTYTWTCGMGMYIGQIVVQ